MPPDDGVVVSDEDEPEDKADDLGEDAEEVGSVGKIAPETDVLQSTGAGVQEAEEGQEDAGSELESSVGSKNQVSIRAERARRTHHQAQSLAYASPAQALAALCPCMCQCC